MACRLLARLHFYGFRVPRGGMATLWPLGGRSGRARRVVSQPMVEGSRREPDPARERPVRASSARRHAAIGAEALGRRAHKPLAPSI